MYLTQLGDRLVIELGAKSLNTTTGWKRFQTSISSFDNAKTLTPYPLDIGFLPPNPPPDPSYEDIIKRYDIPYTPGWSRNGDDGSISIIPGGSYDIFEPDKPEIFYTQLYSIKFEGNHYVSSTGSYEDGDEFGVSASVSGDNLASITTITTYGYKIQDGMVSPKEYRRSFEGKGDGNGATFAGDPWNENVSKLFASATAGSDAGALVEMTFKRKH